MNRSGLNLGGVTFEWDGCKARANLRKHRVEFEDAATVFSDALATDRGRSSWE